MALALRPGAFTRTLPITCSRSISSASNSSADDAPFRYIAAFIAASSSCAAVSNATNANNSKVSILFMGQIKQFGAIIQNAVFSNKLLIKRLHKIASDLGRRRFSIIN